MKKKQNKTLGVSALQLTLALSLMSLSAVLFASSFKASPSSGGGSGRGYVVVNPAVSGGPETDAPKPAAVLPEIDLPALPEVKAPERKERAFMQPSLPTYGHTRTQPQAGHFDELTWEPAALARPHYPRVTCTSTASGNWSSPGIWSCGFVPTASDDAVIASGHAVTIDTAAVALNLTVNGGGVLQYDPAFVRSLTLGGNATVSGIFQANPAGVINTHTLSIGGNLTNNGTIDFSQNGNASQVSITFTGAASNTWTGTGATNLKSFTGVTINKGTSNANILTFTPGAGAFLVEGASALGFLAITNGTFAIAGANVFSNPVFGSAAYTIPASGGFWLANASATVVGQNGNPTNHGLLRLGAGIFNMGAVATNVMGAGTGAAFVVEGGVMNVAGRLTSANPVTYTQTGGTVNIAIAGTPATSPSFGFTSTLPTNFMNMSGGAIVLVNTNSLTTAD